MKAKLGPHGILVEKYVPVERKLESGIIIPQTKKLTKPRSKVVAVGPGTEKKPMEARVGDEISFEAANARVVEVEGKEYMLIDASPSANNLLYIHP